jgi:transcriptional regulator with PAS, ATPase and Fis domain
VLIAGESGTGKEIVADLVHAWSSRAQGPLVKLNCAALPDQLLESELFGHERGAFTGAQASRSGRWKAADGGTMMLDEIGELALPLQAKLLRALQDGSYSPLGSDRTLHANVRVVAASNRDLQAAVAEGRFREDLYYRLNVIEIYLPPLRERPDDIIALARRFADEFLDEAARISPATERLLLAYPWPGNVRELRNVLQIACLRARGAVILPEHLSLRVLRGAATAQPSSPADAGGQSLADLEKRQILEMLAACGGNRTRAAERLGIGRRTLLYKLKSYGDTTAG